MCFQDRFTTRARRYYWCSDHAMHMQCACSAHGMRMQCLSGPSEPETLTDVPARAAICPTSAAYVTRPKSTLVKRRLRGDSGISQAASRNRRHRPAVTAALQPPIRR